MKAKLLIAVLAGVLLAGGVAFGAARYLSPSHDRAVEMVPSDAAAYGSVFLDPSMRQKLALRGLLSRFPGGPAGPGAQQAVEKLFQKGLEKAGLDFKTDVEPWLGDEVAVWSSGLPAGPQMGMPSREVPSSMLTSGASSPGPRGAAAVLVATTDGAASMDAVHKAEQHLPGAVGHATYKGIDYETAGSARSAIGVVGNFLVMGSLSGFQATVDTYKGDSKSLSSLDSFNNAQAGLRSDRLALLYVGPQALTAAMPAMMPGGMGMLFGAGGAGGLGAPSAAVIYARPDGLVIDGRGPIASDLDYQKSAALLKALPGGSWFGLADPGFGTRLRQLYNGMTSSFGLGAALVQKRFKQQTGLDLQHDILGWMGSLGVFVEGTTPDSIGVGATISSSDPATTVRMLGRLAALAAKSGQKIHHAGGPPSTYALSAPLSPQAIYLSAGSQGLQAAYGAAAWRDLNGARSTLGHDLTFKDAVAALGDGYEPTMYLNIGDMVSLAEASGAASDPHYAGDIAPLLHPLDYAVLGSTKSHGDLVTRLVIGIG